MPIDFSNTLRYRILINFILLAFAGSTSNANTIPATWNIPKAEHIHMNRGHFLENIKKELCINNNQVSIMHIYGPSGSGKTYTSKKFANHFKDDYDIAYFIDTKMSMSEQFKKLLLQVHVGSTALDIELSTPEDVAINLNNFLRTTKLRWLIILDNTNSNSSFEQYIPDHCNTTTAHVLITSQNSQSKYTSQLIPMPTIEESTTYLKQAMNKRADTAEDLIKLSYHLQQYPIALTRAATYLNTNYIMSIHEYIQLISKIDELDPNNSTKSTILASIKEIQKRDHMAYDLLQFIAMVHSRNIPGDLLKSWFLSFVNDDVILFNQAIQKLQSYSMIVPSEPNNSKDFSHFDTHDFIQKVIRDNINNKLKIKYNQEFIITIRNVFMQDNKDIINPIFSEAIDHINTAHASSIELNHVSNEFLSLLTDLLEHTNTYKRDYSSSSFFIKQVSPFFEKSPNGQEDTYARFHLTAGRFYWRMGRLDLCKKHLKNVINITSLCNFENNIRLNIYMSDLYNDLGESKKSKYHLDLISETVNKHGYSIKPGNSTHYYLKALHYMSLAEYYFMTGKIEEALKDITLGINVANDYYITKTHNTGPIAVMAPLYNTKNILLLLKQEEQSSHLIESTSEAIIQHFYNQTHRFSALCKVIYAFYKQEHSQNDSAEYIQKAIQEQNSWFNSEKTNKEQILSHILLGKLYHKRGQNNLALKHFVTAIDISNNIFTNKENFVFSQCLFEISKTYICLNMRQEAHSIYKQHIKIFGSEHINSKRIFTNIVTKYI